MLFLIANSLPVPWTGEPIDDITYPANIEQLWTADDLAALGLYVPQDADLVPDGKMVTSSSVEVVDGGLKWVNTLADAPLPDLQPYQFFAVLQISGHATALDAFVDALPAPQNIIARAKLDHSLSFQRDNELVLAARQALGISDADLDALWLQAATL